MEKVKVYYPDIVLVISMKYLDENTIAALREVAPKAVFVGRDDDCFPEKNLGRIAIAKKMDIVVATNAGRFLRTYKEARIPACAFIPNPCDPDIQHPYEVEEKWKSDIIFTGKEEHAEIDRNTERYDLLLKLSQVPNAKLYGHFAKSCRDWISTEIVNEWLDKLLMAVNINHTNETQEMKGRFYYCKAELSRKHRKTLI